MPQMFAESHSLTTDPAWPWSMSDYGLPALALVALLLAGLTVWTYSGARSIGPRRLAVVLALRFLALVLAIAGLLRPALAARDDLKAPAVLILLVDSSESMTIQDAFSNLSRWAALRKVVERCQPVLQQLRDEQNVNVIVKAFAEDLRNFDPETRADGKRTDIPLALHQLFAEHGQQRHFRGLLVLSDGANNGTSFSGTTEAERFRSRSCRLYTFALGQTTTSSRQRDINITAIIPEPAPVPVKNRLKVRVLVDAPGFDDNNAVVPVRLLIDDNEVAVQQERLTKTAGTELTLWTIAPDKPGEIKVTVKIDPQIGEAITANNEISTYVTVTKEGLSVLYVEGRLRAFEPKFIKEALKDPRIRLDELVRLRDEPLAHAVPQGRQLSEAEVLRFEKQHYDVVILGDLTPQRLTGGDPAVLTRIHDAVKNKGTGLMMIGGYQSFGNSWRGSKLADLLPVELDQAGQVDSSVQMVPTQEGLGRFVMRLADDPKKNADLWEKLPKLRGLTPLGARKTAATVLARAGDPVTGAPLLVSQDYGAGRVLAFGGDSTEEWRKLDALTTRAGVALHARFWKQLVLWLARQEEATGNVWVRPDARRIPAGDKLGFAVGVRSKGGVDLPGGEFNVKVINPHNVESVVSTSRDAGGDERGAFVGTDQPGEYRIMAHGKATDTDGQVIDGAASVRFLVYQDTAEMTQQAANHDYLNRLAQAGGGKALRAEDLPRFLQDLKTQPLPHSQKAKTELWPDWRQNRLSPFLLAFYLLFVAVLALEWFLRRSWGLV